MDVTQVVQNFEDLDMAARVDYLVSRPPEERTVLFAYLLLGTHDEIREIKRERRWLYGAGHLIAALIGGVAGVFGQPLRP